MAKRKEIRRANARRGEIEAVLDGKRRILCLTLASLAELETAFQAEDLTALATRFSQGRLKAQDMITILAAGLRGGGASLDEGEVAAMRAEGGLAELARLTGALLSATFDMPQESTNRIADRTGAARGAGDAADP
ncbi:gene transfer agent family protein [Rhizobium sp. YIM 134829]|uniref:gene transfer agent family protein n=1 Tax=Rhizobium sp. YIM 134829 TaxID=3390453 RepID=UPI00397A9655